MNKVIQIVPKFVHSVFHSLFGILYPLSVDEISGTGFEQIQN